MRSLNRWTLTKAVAALLVAVLAPGVRGMLNGRRLIGATALCAHTLLLGAIGVVVWSWRDDLLGLTFHTGALRLLVVLSCVWAAVAVVSVITCAADLRWELETRAKETAMWAAAAMLAALVCAPAAASTWFSVPQISLLETSIVDAPVAQPHQIDGDRELGSTTVEDPPAAGLSALATPDGRFSILLIGSDAGKGRWGERADSLNLVSIDVTTGRILIIGVPRNLTGAPMPPGKLRDKNPDGYPGLINALMTYAASNEKLVGEALGNTEHPGASLTAAAVAELTGVRVDGWVTVTMAGFIELVDALGTIEIHVPKAVPPGGATSADKHRLPPMYKVGWNTMDGTDALAYARSRRFDSDYARMSRQRCVLLSIGAQAQPARVALRWPQISAAMQTHLRTNLDPEQINALRRLREEGDQQISTLSLTPPRISSSNWDLTEVRRLVFEEMNRPSEPKNGPAPTGEETPANNRPVGAGGPTTTTTVVAHDPDTTPKEIDGCKTRR